MMSGRDPSKLEKFKHDLRSFFKGNRSTSNSSRLKDDIYILTMNVEESIGPQSPIHCRLAILKDIGEIVLHNRIEDAAPEKIYYGIRDILSKNFTKDQRIVVYNFFQNLIHGQYDKLTLIRNKIFYIVRSPLYVEDNLPKFELFLVLTENGKDIRYFEKEVGPFVAEWMPHMVACGKALEFLCMLINLTKYNSAYLDEEVIYLIIQNTCFLCCNSNADKVIGQSIQLLDVIVCYSKISQNSVAMFVSTLSRTINVEKHSADSLKIMKNLAGTDMGFHCLREMSATLRDKSSYKDTCLVRGLFLHLNVALWNQRPSSIVNFISDLVLPCYDVASECDNPSILLEVARSSKLLVDKYGVELKDYSWSLIFAVLETILEKTENIPCGTQCKVQFHEIIGKVDALIEKSLFTGCIYEYYDFIGKWSFFAPECAVTRLIDYLRAFISPSYENWLDNLESMVSCFYSKESTPDIRNKIISVLECVIGDHKYLYEKEIIDRGIYPFFQDLVYESNHNVRYNGVRFLTKLLSECKPDNYEPLVEILEKGITKPFVYPEEFLKCEEESVDFNVILNCFCESFFRSILEPPPKNAVRFLAILVNFLQNHYDQPKILEARVHFRLKVLECFLKLCSDPDYHLGYSDSALGAKYSHHLLVDYRRSSNLSVSTISSTQLRFNQKSPGVLAEEEAILEEDASFISLSSACNVVATALSRETDWNVLHPLLLSVPQALRNKALILSRNYYDVEQLVTALISIIKERNYPEELKNTPVKFTKTDFYDQVIPMLSTFASYHTHLDLSLQKRLIKCLEVGLVSRSARQCVTALTTCLLEMRDAMVNLLPEILLNLSKISTTVHVAIPILEFLSMLTTFPKVFASLVTDQYMSVFAIILPYTNAYKYNHYTVSMAHHVIAVWFLKCRMTFRKDFVHFIMRSLDTNLMNLILDSKVFVSPNQDSGNRKRSSSLTEQGSKKKDRLVSSSSRLAESNSFADLKPIVNDAMKLFHKELNETCLDLLSHFTYTNSSALPKRHPSYDAIFQNGQSTMWLLGAKLIKVTTSGCSQKIIRNGLCDKCSRMCIRKQDSKEEIPVPESDSKYPSSDISSNSNHASASSASSSKSSLTSIEDTKRIMLDSFDRSDDEPKVDQSICTCWCQGWAEIYIRRPTGDMSWMMRIQNVPQNASACNIFSSDDASIIFESSHTSKEFKLESLADKFNPVVIKTIKEACTAVLSDRNVRANYSTNMDSDIREKLENDTACPNPNALLPHPPEYADEDTDPNSNLLEEASIDEIFQSRPSKAAVYRINSISETCNWKLLTMEQYPDSKKGGKLNCLKDMRSNCEAIPEEVTPVDTVPMPATSSTMTQTSPSHLPDQGEVNSKSSPVYPRSPQRFTDNRRKDFAESSSSSYEEVNIKGNMHDFRSCLPNEEFEFNRSASVSRAMPGFKRLSPGVMSMTHLASSQPHLVGKPPLSPPANLLSKASVLNAAANKHSKDNTNNTLQDSNDQKRQRVHTISVMNTTRRPQDWEFSSKLRMLQINRNRESARSGVNPSFVFLQLYHSSQFGDTMEQPLLVPNTPAIQRAINVFDLIPPYETHKVGVLYVGHGQNGKEIEILGNRHGSARYMEFLQKLGTLVKLEEVNPQNTYLGGLESNGDDGKFASIWKDDIVQVIFHVATLMPNKSTDLQCNNKKKHIGNDYVTIVYNESNEDYKLNTVKCQFNFGCIVIEPLNHGSNQVTIKAREELMEHVGHIHTKIVSDENVSLLARQLALHLNLASMIVASSKDKNCNIYASNWLERLRNMKRLRSKVLDEMANENASDYPNKQANCEKRIQTQTNDFTKFT